MVPAMASVVTVDKAGRIVIPLETRDAQGLRAGTKMLLVEGEGGLLYLEPLDHRQVAERLRKEMRGVDLKAIVRRVESKANRLAKARYPSLARR